MAAVRLALAVTAGWLLACAGGPDAVPTQLPTVSMARPMPEAASKPTAAPTVAVGTEDAVRDWFPDTFLWVPVLETDDDGKASLDVEVPDTLTRWRILALAHDRGGQQAGTVGTFVSRLPVYVEPELPAYLFTGDRLVLPVRAGNATDRGLVASLAVSAHGALAGGLGTDTVLGAGGLVEALVTVRAVRSGEATVRASVVADGVRDEVVRTLRVVAGGVPVAEETSGTVTDTVALTVPSPDGFDEELMVTVFPGPLALLRAEGERVVGDTPLPGSGLALAALIEEAADRAGVDVGAAALRRLRLVAFQAMVRSIPRAGPREAADLLLAGGDDRAVGGFESARASLTSTLIAAQRPDGTWSSSARSTLQRVVVETVHAARVLPEEATTARLRAEGACERHAHASDPYTAAVLVGSGLVRSSVAEPLVAEIRAALVREPVLGVEVPPSVVNAWGERPSEVEMLAWTVLALPEDDPDRGVLAVDLMGRWEPGVGFGAGKADLVALEAVVAAVPGASGPTGVKLVVDRRVVATAELDPGRPPVVLRAPAGREQALVLDPPVDGVAWHAVRRGWVPIVSEGLPGLDVETRVSEPLEAGVESTVRITLSGPRGAIVTVVQGLPAGATVRLPSAEGVDTIEVLGDRVRLRTAPLQAGLLTIPIPVIPAFGGRFSTVPQEIGVDGEPLVAVAPLVWDVRP